MKICILYFAGCPNHPPVVEMVKRVVAEHRLSATIEEVDVAPEQVGGLRFLGSPTVHVDGVDIEPAARTRTDYAMSCRFYGTPDGLPPKAMLMQALGVVGVSTRVEGTAASAGGARTGMLAAAGSVVTAILASACCWLPLLLVAFGGSAAWASDVFERWRPIFIVLAVTMLGVAFYTHYRRRPTCEGGCCPGGTRGTRRARATVLWVSAAFVAVMVFAPERVIALVRQGPANTSAAASATVPPDSIAITFDVEGMTCDGCAVTLSEQWMRVPGVHAVEVDFPTRSARAVVSDPFARQGLVDAAARAGFTTIEVSSKPAPE